MISSVPAILILATQLLRLVSCVAIARSQRLISPLPHNPVFQCCSATKGCELFPVCPPGYNDYALLNSTDLNAYLPSKGSWINVNCDYGTLPDSGADPSQRWTDAGAQDAWQWALKAAPIYMIHHPDDTYANFQFSQQIGQLFNANENRLCNNVGDDSCDITPTCDQSSDPGAHGVNSRAGYLILTAMSNLHKVLDDFDKGCTEAQAFFDAQSILNDFGNFGSYQDLELALDIVGVVFGAIFAPTWNYVLKNWDGVIKDSIKDAVLSSAAGAIVLATNKIKEDNNEADVAGDLDIIANTLITALQQSNRDNCQQIFDGTNTATLTSLFQDGTALRTLDPGSDAVATSLIQAVTAAMIPIAWQKTTNPGYPWIMTDDGIPKKGDSCNAYTLDDGLTKSGIDEKSCAYINGRGYWLIMQVPGNNYCYYHPNSCTGGQQTFFPVPGLDALDGQSYRGLTVQDLIASSVNSWTANNQKNGWTTNVLNSLDTASLEDMANNGVRAKGIFNVPLCSEDEALSNVLKSPYSGWPCNPP